MRKKGVEILADVITTAKQVEPENASIIEFKREGDDNVSIMGAITLDSENPSFSFIYPQNRVIKNNIPVSFAGVGANPKCVVIKSIYE